METKEINGDRVFIIHNGEAYFCKSEFGPMGLSFTEAKKIIEREGWDAEIYSVEDEVKKYQLKENLFMKSVLTPECYMFKLWQDAYTDRNISISRLPIVIENNNDYEKELYNKLNEFLNALKKPAFIYDRELIKTVTDNCENVKNIFKYLLTGNQKSAEKMLIEYLKSFMEDDFIVSELDKSYAFRGIAPFEVLHHQGDSEMYSLMMDTDLTFFRMRVIEKNNPERIEDLSHIVHLPYRLACNATEMRFNRAGSPCLYLGTTTKVCADECQWNRKEQNLYGAVFVPDKNGSKIKILNMILSQHLSNGIHHEFGKDDKALRRHIQNEILKLYPLVLAMSFNVKTPDNNTRKEYLISQCLMDVLHRVGIDGIAYLSARGEDEFQYPHGVNLALPAYDISDIKPFSKYCNMFKISKPVKFEGQDTDTTKSYINTIYTKYLEGATPENEAIESFISKISLDGKSVFYGETEFAKFDNYLCSLPRFTM